MRRSSPRQRSSPDDAAGTSPRPAPGTTTSSDRRRGGPLPRLLHPGAWWGWAVALAVAVTATTSVPLLLLTAAAVALVLAARRQPGAPWAGAWRLAVLLGVVAVVVRVVLGVLVGLRTGEGQVLVDLPSWQPLGGADALPRSLRDVTLLGPVTDALLVRAAVGGLQLAVLLLVLCAATSLVSPYRLLRVLPASLHEVGVVVAVAVNLVPATVTTARDVVAARRLRGRPVAGPAGVRGLVGPVLEATLERSLHLAESLDSRGYGRRPPGTSRHDLGALLLLAGLVAAVLAAYGLLTRSGAGAPLAVVAAVLLVASLRAAGRRSGRTRVREPWRAAETAVLACGVVAAGAVLLAARRAPASVDPVAAGVVTALPSVPLLAVAGLLVAALPAALAPPPPALHRPDRPARPKSTHGPGADAWDDARPARPRPEAVAAGTTT